MQGCVPYVCVYMCMEKEKEKKKEECQSDCACSNRKNMLANRQHTFTFHSKHQSNMSLQQNREMYVKMYIELLLTMVMSSYPIYLHMLRDCIMNPIQCHINQ